MAPMIERFKELKERYPSALLLFRLGDFYEAYGDDAAVAADVLGITLTRRQNTPYDSRMAGFPFHALDAYLVKLIRAGYRVAICDPLPSEQGDKKPPFAGKELSLFTDVY